LPQNIKECPICKRKTKDNVIVATKGKFSSEFVMVQCKNCEVFYHNEYFTKDELKKYYNNLDSNGMMRNVHDKIPKGKTIQEDVMKKRSWASGNKFKHIHLIPEGIKVLDIGSGGGGAGRYLQNTRHCESTFIEPNVQWYNMLKKEKLNVIQGFFEDIELKDKFDWIIMGDVLEHFLDPVLVVDKIHNLLVDSGKFYFNTPIAPNGIVSQNSDLDMKKYAFQIPHFTIFTKNTLTKLLINFSNFEYMESYYDSIIATK
jgi:2-polyprenyl-3-methyl-5-hydroxy-6-metoxy-1,4-benzoquinol methylase